MTALDLAGHLAYAATASGHVILVRSPEWKRSGLALRLAGDLGWVALGFALGLSSVVVWGLVFAAADGWALVKR